MSQLAAVLLDLLEDLESQGLPDRGGFFFEPPPGEVVVYVDRRQMQFCVPSMTTGAVRTTFMQIVERLGCDVGPLTIKNTLYSPGTVTTPPKVRYELYTTENVARQLPAAESPATGGRRDS